MARVNSLAIRARTRAVMFQYPGRSNVIASVAVAFGVTACSVDPRGLTDAETSAFAGQLLTTTISEAEPVVGKLTPMDAVRRAKRNNQAIRTRILEAAVARNKLQVASNEMLPSLVAESDLLSARSAPRHA